MFAASITAAHAAGLPAADAVAAGAEATHEEFGVEGEDTQVARPFLLRGLGLLGYGFRVAASSSPSSYAEEQQAYY